jgi:hypothetical protein
MLIKVIHILLPSGDFDDILAHMNAAHWSRSVPPRSYVRGLKRSKRSGRALLAARASLLTAKTLTDLDARRIDPTAVCARRAP